MSYKTLRIVRGNESIVAGLPANTSHVLHSLNVSVFVPLKEGFKLLLSLWKFQPIKISVVTFSRFMSC